MALFEDFIATQRSDETRKMYAYGVRRVVKDPERFLALAKSNSREAEDELTAFILANRKRVSAATLSNWVNCVRFFLQYDEVNLNWKKVLQPIPARRRVGNDRAPTIEEMRKALGFADAREKVVLLLMASSGIRVGGWKWLTVGDVEFGEPTRLRIYHGELDEYTTFISPEASEAVRQYLGSRERAGEQLTPESPLLRDKWDEELGATGVPTPLSISMVRTLLWNLWKRAGVWIPGRKSPFKLAHGTRKWFRTNASKAASREDVEAMLGHADPYYKPDVEHLKQEYLKAIPALVVDEKFKLRQELESKEKVHESEWTRTRLENLELREEVRRQGEVLRDLAPLIAEMKAVRSRELENEKLER